MCSTKEASDIVKELAEPRRVDDSVKAAILRVARLLKWKPGRVQNIWYQHPEISISAVEWSQLKAAADARTINKQEGVIHEAGLSELRAQIMRLEERIEALDHRHDHQRWGGNHPPVHASRRV